MNTEFIILISISSFLVFMGCIVKIRKVYYWVIQRYGYKLTKEEKENPSKKQLTHARLSSFLLLFLGLPLLAGTLVLHYFKIYQYLHYFIGITFAIWIIVFAIVCYRNKDIFIDSFKYYGPRTKREY